MTYSYVQDSIHEDLLDDEQFENICARFAQAKFPVDGDEARQLLRDILQNQTSCPGESRADSQSKTFDKFVLQLHVQFD